MANKTLNLNDALYDYVLWDGAVVEADKHDESTEAIRALNMALHADTRIELAMLPIADGLTAKSIA